MFIVLNKGTNLEHIVVTCMLSRHLTTKALINMRACTGYLRLVCSHNYAERLCSIFLAIGFAEQRFKVISKSGPAQYIQAYIDGVIAQKQTF